MYLFCDGKPNLISMLIVIFYYNTAMYTASTSGQMDCVTVVCVQNQSVIMLCVFISGTFGLPVIFMLCILLIMCELKSYSMSLQRMLLIFPPLYNRLICTEMIQSYDPCRHCTQYFLPCEKYKVLCRNFLDLKFSGVKYFLCCWQVNLFSMFMNGDG